MTGKLDDKIMSTDMLISQKFIMSTYNIAISECQSDSLRNMLMDMYNEEQGAQKKIFDSMTNKGWYQVPKADMTAISQTKSRFAGAQQRA